MPAASPGILVHDQLHRPLPHLARYDQRLPSRHDLYVQRPPELLYSRTELTSALGDPFSVYCLYLAAILFSFILPDYLGRRPMLIWGAVVCASCLTIVSALNVGISPSTISSQKAGLAMIFIWYFTFGVSSLSLQLALLR